MNLILEKQVKIRFLLKSHNYTRGLDVEKPRPTVDLIGEPTDRFVD